MHVNMLQLVQTPLDEQWVMITALMHSPENPITVDTDSDKSEDGSDDEGTVWNDEEDLV